MIKLESSIYIACPVDAAFAVIADVAGYARWLPQSRVFAGCTSTERLGVGTTYVDQVRAGLVTIGLQGVISTDEPPHRVTFHERTPFVLPIYDVQVEYTVTPVDAGSLVQRQLCVTLAGMFRLLAPIMRGAARAEGDRILRVLKDTLERPNGTGRRSIDENARERDA